MRNVRLFQYPSVAAPPPVIDSGSEAQTFIFTSTVVAYSSKVLYKAVQEPPLGIIEGQGGTGLEWWYPVYPDILYDKLRIADLYSPRQADWFFFHVIPIPTVNTENIRWTDPQPYARHVMADSNRFQPAIRSPRPATRPVAPAHRIPRHF